MGYSFLRNAKCALDGLVFISRSERHFQVHIVWSLTVILLASFWSFSLIEWMYLGLTITSVMTAEIFNTVVENIIDYLSPEYSEFARITKDMAASAVLLTVIHSVFAGYLLFFKRVATLFVGG